MAKIRTFIALELPYELKEAFAHWQQRLREHTDCVRWVKAENIHLTLKFLGSIDEGQVEPVSRILENICRNSFSFTLHVSGVGAFPNSRNPKIVWAGMEGDQKKLLEFQKHLEDALAMIGFVKEKRPYSPHLTLGRVKESRGKRDLKKALNLFSREDLGQFIANTIIFFRSELYPSGPTYTPLKIIELKPQSVSEKA